jgi:phosphate transport system substrate-binding protein
VRTWKLSWLTTIVISAILFTSHVAFSQEKQIVRISGALPLTDMVSEWAAEYMKRKPDVQVTVFGKTAGYGYSQFIDGQANVVMASRKMTEKEQQQATAKGIHVADRKVMDIPVAMVTSAKNPVSSLSLDQLRDIYAGGISNWKDVGGPDEAIKVLMRPYPDTGVAVLFKDEVLKTLDYRKDALVMSSFKNMIHICEQALAIGHIPSTAAFCDPVKYQIKVLALKKDADSPAVLPYQPDYPLNMPFFFAWNADSPSKEVEDFVQFAIAKGKERRQISGAKANEVSGK